MVARVPSNVGGKIFGALILITTISVCFACDFPVENRIRPLVVGCDHIPIAVKNLNLAVEDFVTLGFTLKPGRHHENGIQNQHVKLSDGTALELISVSDPSDALAMAYIDHIARGDGPVFAGLYSPDLDSLAQRLGLGNFMIKQDGGLLVFPEPDPLRYLFFGPREQSPTDLPEYFRHKNTAQGLMAVWIAGDDLSLERQLFEYLGAEFSEESVYIPDKSLVQSAAFEQCKILFLPASRQIYAGRKIVGVTLRIDDVDALREMLPESSPSDPIDVSQKDWQSTFIPPEHAHGLWLEFRQNGDS